MRRSSDPGGLKARLRRQVPCGVIGSTRNVKAPKLASLRGLVESQLLDDLRLRGTHAPARLLLVATTTAAATVAAATAAATTTTVATTAAAAATALFARSGFVDRQAAAFDFLEVQGLDGGLSLAIVAHFDKAEAFAAAGVTVLYDRGVLYLAKF